MATINLGRIKPVFRGAYAGGTAYVVDDIVTHGNESFICIQAGTGNATSNASYWTKLAAKGSDGTDVGATLTTQGDILYRDGSGLQRLVKGTAGQVLKMNAAANAPEYGTISSDFVKLGHADNISNGSGSATLDLDGLFTSDYNVYKIYGTDICPVSSSDVRVRFRSGGSAHTCSHYIYASGQSYTDVTPTHLWTTAGGAYSDYDNPDPAIYLGADDHNNALAKAGALSMTIYDPLGTNNHKAFQLRFTFQGSNIFNGFITHGYVATTTAMSGVQFFYNGTNINGRFTMYGLTK